MWRTFFEQCAKVTAFPWGIAKKIEEFFCNSFQKNAIKVCLLAITVAIAFSHIAQGREIMEDAIGRVTQEYAENMTIVEEFTSKLKQEADQFGTKLKLQAEELSNKIKREAEGGYD